MKLKLEEKIEKLPREKGQGLGHLGRKKKNTSKIYKPRKM